MNRRRVMLMWGVLLIALLMLGALPVAWASPTQSHGRFTVPTRTPTGSPATQAPTQAPTDEPPPTQEQPTDEPTTQPPPSQAPTNTPASRTATPTPHSSTGTHTRTLPTTPTVTPLPTLESTLTASPTPDAGTASPTATASPTPEDTPSATLTITPAGDEAQLGQMGGAVTNTDAEAGATGVPSETTETLTTSGSAPTETLSSSPAITSSQSSAGVVTVTPFGSEGETERRRISPLFLGGVVAIILGVVIWFLGKQLRGPSAVVPEPNHAVPREVERVGLEEGSEALPSPTSDVSEANNPPALASYSGEEDGA